MKKLAIYSMLLLNHPNLLESTLPKDPKLKKERDFLDQFEKNKKIMMNSPKKRKKKKLNVEKM